MFSESRRLVTCAESLRLAIDRKKAASSLLLGSKSETGVSMRTVHTFAGVLAALTFAQAASAQLQTMMVPVGGGVTKPVPQHPVDLKDSPEEIAKDAQRDLRDNRFYNKPGATRAQYDADWQECRLIARGSRTPAGTVPLVYNPAVMSPLAAGVGGAIGSMIGAAIVEGEMRRANRKNCLLIRGWRLVELRGEAAARVSAMSDADRNSYFNQVIGAAKVDGEITERKSFSVPPEVLGKVDGGLSGPESLFFGKKVDPSAPAQLTGNEAAVVLAFRRPGPASAGRFLEMNLTRYDPQAQDLVYQPRDWKKKGDTTTYNAEVASGDRKAGLEVQMVKLTPGDYVISGVSFMRQIMSTNCFGAPNFHLSAGEVLYLGDFIPLWGATGPDGKKISGTGYVSRIEDARRLLATKQPQLAAAMKPAKIVDGATYACSAITMDRWDITGPESSAAATPTAAGS